MTESMKTALKNEKLQVFKALSPKVQKSMLSAARKGRAEYMERDGTWDGIERGQYSTLMPGVVYRIVEE